MMESYITVSIEKKSIGSLSIGKLVMFKKEADSERIGAYLPIIGRIGWVADDRESIVKGTCSASRIYDAVSDVFHGKVMFFVEDGVIFKLIIEKKQQEIQLFNLSAMRQSSARGQ